MKKCNVNILLFIGLLAVGLTTFAMVKTEDKRIGVPNCYRKVTSAYRGSPTCTFSLFALVPGVNCELLDLLAEQGLSEAPGNYFTDVVCVGSY